MLKNYIKIAWKVLLRRKFFTFVSLFGISFTLMVLMIVAALLTHFLAPAEPGSRLDRSLLVGFVEMYGEDFHMITTPSFYFLEKQETGAESQVHRRRILGYCRDGFC
jgi:putative ABC transport system permease protein